MHAPLLASLLVVLLATSGLPPLQFRGMHGPAPAATLPATPLPDACTVEPRDAESLVALLGPPEPMDFPTTDPDAPVTRVIEIPVGRPATPEVREGIVATILEFYACSNAGDMRRAFALGTDHYLQHYGDSGTLTAEDIAFLAGDPVPVPAEFQTAVIAVTNVTVLGDGRAAAFVALDAAFDDPSTELMILAKQGERWLIDAIIEFALQ